MLITHTLRTGRPVSGSVSGGQLPVVAVIAAAGVIVIVLTDVGLGESTSISRLSRPCDPVIVTVPERLLLLWPAAAAGTTSASAAASRPNRIATTAIPRFTVSDPRATAQAYIAFRAGQGRGDEAMAQAVAGRE